MTARIGRYDLVFERHEPLTWKGAIASIQEDTAYIAREYMDIRGWAPDSAAAWMTECRLLRFASLARALDHTFLQPKSAESLDGRLILAWAHIGSIVEMGMQIILALHYEAFRKDPNRQVRDRDGNDFDLELDQTSLEQLRVFFNKSVWLEPQAATWSPWITTVLERRNAIHAFRDRTLGGWQDVEEGVITTARFMDAILRRLPPPPSDFSRETD